MWDAIVGDALSSIVPKTVDDLQYRPDLLQRMNLVARTDDDGRVKLFDADTMNRVNDTSALDEAFKQVNALDPQGRLAFGTGGPLGYAGNRFMPGGVDLNGSQYTQIEHPYHAIAGIPQYADMLRQAGVTPEDFSYNDQYGNLLANNDRTLNFQTTLAQEIAKQNEGGLDKLFSMGPIILGAAGTGAALSGAFGAGAVGAEGAGAGGATWGYPQSWNMIAGEIPEGGMTLAGAASAPSFTTEQLAAALAGGEGAAAGGAAGGAGFTTEALQAALTPYAGSMSMAPEFIGGQTALASGLTASGGGALTFADLLKAASSPLGRTALSAGGGVLSAILGSNAAKGAADTQVKSAGDANALIAAMFDQNRADLEPWRTAGGLSLAELSRRLGIAGDPASGGYGSLTTPFSTADLNADPIYGAQRDFLAKTGQDRILNAASARGESDSGTTLKALMDYANGVVSTTGNDAFNRNNASKAFIANLLSGVSGTGQTTATQVAGMGTNAVNQQANNITSAGAVNAAGQVGSANAITGAINNTLQSYQTAQQQAAMQPFIDAATMALLKRFLPNAATAE